MFVCGMDAGDFLAFIANPPSYDLVGAVYREEAILSTAQGTQCGPVLGEQPITLRLPAAQPAQEWEGRPQGHAVRWFHEYDIGPEISDHPPAHDETRAP
jgi:hypothetical protein